MLQIPLFPGNKDHWFLELKFGNGFGNLRVSVQTGDSNWAIITAYPQRIIEQHWFKKRNCFFFMESQWNKWSYRTGCNSKYKRCDICIKIIGLFKIYEEGRILSWRGVDQLFSKNLEISISLVSVHGIGEVCTCCLVDILACTLHVPSLPSFFLFFFCLFNWVVKE